MSIYRVIDKLESTVKEGVWMPFGYRMIGLERTLDLIEKLRASLPDEVGRAKQVTQEKERLLSQAKEQADRIVEEASSTKSQLLDENELARSASRKAEELVAAAEAKAAEIRRGADEYADRVLSQLDGALGGALASVQKGRQTLAASLSGVTSNGARSKEYR